MKMSNVSLGSALLVSAMATFVCAQDKEATSTPKEATSKSSGVPAASIPKVGPITVTVELVGGQKINGTLTEVTTIPIRTAFGEASVPLAAVAGIKLASPEDSSTTVIMKNGDSITGATDLKIIGVDTEWGSAKINGSSVMSILLLPDLKWNATNGINGKRWSLVDVKSAPGTLLPGTPGTAGTSSPFGTQPTRTGTVLQNSTGKGLPN